MIGHILQNGLNILLYIRGHKRRRDTANESKRPTRLQLPHERQIRIHSAGHLVNNRLILLSLHEGAELLRELVVDGKEHVLTGAEATHVRYVELAHQVVHGLVAEPLERYALVRETSVLAAQTTLHEAVFRAAQDRFEQHFHTVF